MGQYMLNHRINLLPRIAESLPQLSKTYKLVLITKGGSTAPEQKLAQ